VWDHDSVLLDHRTRRGKSETPLDIASVCCWVTATQKQFLRLDGRKPPGRPVGTTSAAKTVTVLAIGICLTEIWLAYSDSYGDETTVVKMHSGNGEHDEMDRRAIACLDLALADVGLA
jgi:hypothetical protein